MKLFQVISICLLGLVLVACSSATPQPGPAGPTAYPAGATSAPNGAYPAGGSFPTAPTASAGYPAPSSKGPAPTTAPALPSVTPDSTKATVTGILLSKGKPAANVSLYLAKVIKDASGKEITLSLDKNASPAAVTDSNGKYTFYNVPNDTYGMILDVGIASYALPMPNSQNQIRVNVTSNQPIDLGTLDFTDLPGSGI